MSQKRLLFVYGTLKKHRYNNIMLKNCDLIGDAVTIKDFTLLCPYSFPYMCYPIYGKKQLPVVGEVYEVNDEEVIEELDILEGVLHNHYQRIKEKVFVLKSQKEIEVELYIASPDTARRTLNEKECKTISLQITPNYKGQVFVWN